jgi:CubicO group peptidase (beta-lactamase class C family)
MGTGTFAFKDGVGFGLDFMVVSDPKTAALPVGKGILSWGGAAGTWFWIDPTNDLYFVGMIQRMGAKPGAADLPGQAQALTYKALTHPEK